MRTNCDWFIDKISTIWGAKPGRSILTLVPQGCDETEASQLVRAWTERNFKPPAPFENHRPVCISLTTDSLISCEHFALTFAKRFIRPRNVILEGDPDDFPTDIIQNAVEAMLAAGYFPIVAIERFHAFALIRDSGMTSVLSGMRTLENSGQLTTLSFSPLTYSMIRRLMPDGLPFLNSVYGDNHDQIVMEPLTRQEFLDYASSRGVSVQRANMLYQKGGGPDAIYKALVDVSHHSDNSIIDACLGRTEDVIERFITRSFVVNGEADWCLLTKLALGQLLPQEISFIRNNPLHSFLTKTTPRGHLVCSSQVLARKILRGEQPRWKVYGLCIDALNSGELEIAAEIALMLDDTDPRLTTFKELVLLKASIQPKLGAGLLGVEWFTVIKIINRISHLQDNLPINISDWILEVENVAKIVVEKAAGSLSRLQLDSLTSSSSNPEIRKITLKVLGDYISLSLMLDSPIHKISHLINIPEAILQAVVSGFCEISHHEFKNKFPTAPYDDFFSDVKGFIVPDEGAKLTLTTLMVLVPAILSMSPLQECGPLIDKKLIKSQQQRLVACLRNPASHTLVAFIEKDADFLYELCSLWINTWARMEGYDDFDSFSSTSYKPTAHEISSVILG